MEWVMNISVRGNNEVLNKRELRYAVTFFSYRLLGPRLSKNVSVRVENNAVDGRYWGFCCALDEDFRRYPREFEVVLFQSKQRSKTLETLAHEMVHVKQFARGELRSIGTFDYKWMGQKFNIWDPSYGEANLPWEIEAYGLEKELKEEYLEHVKQEGLTF
jgi:hypothetical protein